MDKQLIANAFNEMPPMLRAAQVIDMMGISQRSFYKLMAAGDLPPCILIGKQKRWLKQAVIEYLAQRACPASASLAAAQRGRAAAAVKNKNIRRAGGTKSKSQQRKEREEGLRIASQSCAVVA